MKFKKQQKKLAQERPAQQLAERVPYSLENLDLCPICGKPFALVVGCHKVCRCGYEEGCGD